MTVGKTFHRHIDVDAEDLGDEIAVRGHLSDSFHEMEVRLRLKKDGLVIVHAEGSMIRAANSRCQLAEPRVDLLKGLALGKGFRAKALELLGRNRGCTHMTSLILQIGDNAIILHAFHKDGEIPDLGPDWANREMEPMLATRPHLRNACISYVVEEEKG